MTGDAREEVTRLLAENRRLRELLTEHGIAWQPPDTMPTTDRSPRLGTDEKVKLFASLFRGREDVYPVRWESKAGKSGYSPACANEWRAGICEKPRIKCGDCAHRALIPVTSQTVFDHLAGRHTVGVYPLLSDDTCHFLAVDFDDAEWREDLHRQRGPGHAVASAGASVQPLARPDAGLTEDHAGQPGLLREGRFATTPGQPADPPGRVPEPRVLQGTGHVPSGVG